MRKQKQRPEKEALTERELQAEQTAELPERTAMSLLDINADLGLAGDAAASLDAAVAANTNVAAPINASVAANIQSVGSTALADADQESIINQYLEGVATAVSDQTTKHRGGR